MFFNRAKKEWPPEKKEIPRELPSLARDIIRKKEESKLAQEPKTVLREQAPVKESPATASIAPAAEAQKQAKEDAIQKPSQFRFETTRKLDDKTYFSNILRSIEQETDDMEKAEKFYKEGILSQDLLSGMKNYWANQKKNILFTSKEDELRQKLLEKINALQNYEREWQNMHLSLIDYEEKIRLGEIELKQMLKDFKELCRRHVFEKAEKERPKAVAAAVLDVKEIRIPPENYFNLSDGRALRSLTELAEALKSMDESTFRHHVNNEKNDFANWIKDVIKNNNLAAAVSAIKTKEEMLTSIRQGL